MWDLSLQAATFTIYASELCVFSLLGKGRRGLEMCCGGAFLYSGLLGVQSSSVKMLIFSIERVQLASLSGFREGAVELL